MIAAADAGGGGGTADGRLDMTGGHRASTEDAVPRTQSFPRAATGNPGTILQVLPYLSY